MGILGIIGIFIGIFIISVIVLLVIIRIIGQWINRRTPKGGINENRMVEINGSKQWISIYGKNLNNPVILSLHGGPGSSESLFDYASTRKWADVYTVVSWDQRNCGKSYSKDQNNVRLTYDLFIEDGKAMTEFILKYLKKDKITIIGHSWGTYFGCNLVRTYPMYYENYIGVGQVVDFAENEAAFKEEAIKWAQGDESSKKLLDRLTLGDYTVDYLYARYDLMKKYHYDILADGTDYNIITTVLFNPYYSILDILKYVLTFKENFSYYNKFLNSEEFVKKFSLLDKTEYEVPYYNVLGDRDYQTNHIQAEEYFERVKAPRKKLYIMKNMTHGLLLTRTKEFSEILHDIYRNEHPSDSNENNIQIHPTTINN